MSNDLDSVIKRYKGLINVEPEREYVSMGPLPVNLACGNPQGVVSGKLIQIIGRESAGKSTLASDIVAQWQKAHMPTDKENGFAAWVDFERSYSRSYAESCGIDTERVLRITPSDAEEGFTVLLDLIKDGGVKLAVIDSAAAAIPSLETEKKLTDNAKMAGVASVLTRFVQHAVPIIDSQNATIVIINQYRKNFSTLSPKEEVAFGGMALQYAVSVNIHLARIKTESEEQRVRAIIQKNKVGSPQMSTEFFITYGAGIDHAKTLIHDAKEKGIIRGTNWLTMDTPDGEVKANGLDKAAAAFPLNILAQQIIERSVKHVD